MDIVLKQDHGHFYIDGNEVTEDEFNKVAADTYELVDSNKSNVMISVWIKT